MDIHIDRSGIDIDIEEIRHLHALRYHAVVGCDDGLVEIRMPHVSPIDEEEFVTALLAGCLRLAHKARDVAERGLNLNRQKILRILSAIDIGYALTQAGRLEVLELSPIMMENKMNVRIDEHDALESLKNIAEVALDLRNFRRAGTL